MLTNGCKLTQPYQEITHFTSLSLKLMEPAEQLSLCFFITTQQIKLRPFLHLKSFRERPLPGAHVRRSMLRLRFAVVLPLSLGRMQTICIWRMWWQPKQVLIKTRVSKLVWDGE